MEFRIPFRPRRPLVAVVPLSGAISAGGGIGRGGLNDAGAAPLIERAFSRGKPAAIALVINSPGGSPAQSSLIAARIRRLAAEKSVPVFAFVEDVAASGGYWLATAADEIFADATSIVGSIGVISASFGLQDFIARHGIERRVHTSGSEKSFLDPFRDERPEDVERLLAIQAQLHEAFIAQVKDRRGARLVRDDIFTGEFWLAGRACELGLIDGIGHLVPKMKERFGDKVRFASYGPRRSLWHRFGAEVTEGMAERMETRLLAARFGVSA